MRKPILTTLILLFLIVIISLSSCSLLDKQYFRELHYTSIFWEDNNHILVHANVSEYHDAISIGGEAIKYNWRGGEIWRIEVNTGEKELLLREESNIYFLGDKDDVTIAIKDTLRLISEWNTTYQMDEDYDNWNELNKYASPVISNDGKEIVVLDLVSGEEEIYIKILNLDSGAETILFQTTENTDIIDYDFDRNLLLLNNNRLVNLNTGLDTVLCEQGDTILGNYVAGGGRHGEFVDSLILINFRTKDDIWHKAYIDVNTLEIKKVENNFLGIVSPNGDKAAHGSIHSVDIYTISGGKILTVEFLENKL